MAEHVVGRRYQLLWEIGSGNMGTVHRALDRLTGQIVALKQVRIPTEKLDYGSRSTNQEAHMTLAQEFRILASLRHPHIISVLDYGFDSSDDPAHPNRRAPYITMELLQDAVPILDSGAGSDRARQLEHIMQMLQALIYLHRRGILHRDLKPRNVLVVDDQVKLLDFGLSVAAEQAAEGEVAGTPSYMAPEIWVGKQATRQSDLYAVGVMLFRMYAGRLPFTSTSLKKLFTEMNTTTPDYSAMDANQAVKDLTAWLLAKDPAARCDDAGEALAALRRATGQPPLPETRAARESFLQAAAFVGREPELARLSGRLADARLGNGSAWLVAGESGVGKSRLLDELRTRALVQGALVLRAQAVRESSDPYAMWRGALRWLVLLAAPDERQLSTLKPLLPDIETLVGRSVPDAPEVPPQVAQTRLLRTIEALFMTQTQTIVLILEDLHWADRDSIVVLELISRLTADLPLMVVGSYRDDENPDLPMLLPAMPLIKLERLTHDETARLTQAMLGPTGSNQALLTLLQRETEGNAFFLVEVVRALAEESGRLDEIGSTPLPQQVLTGGVEGVIQRRLNRVSEPARPLLRLAAVAGRTLDLDVLREATSAGKAMLDLWLNDCADAAVLEVVDGEWRFGHGKLRDGVLRDIPAAELPALHATIARALENVNELKSATSKQQQARLAYHWRMAGDLEREGHYASLAGEQAFRNGAYKVAAELLRRALDLKASFELSAQREAKLRQKLGSALLELQAYDEAAEQIAHSLKMNQEVGYRWGEAESLNLLGLLAAQRDQPEAAARFLLQALEVAVGARAQKVALGSLVAMAALLAKAGDKTVAVEYAALVQGHINADETTHEAARKLIDQLRETLPPDAVREAIERGRALELREVVSRILARH